MRRLFATAFLALIFASFAGLCAAEQTGPQPGDIIRPRSSSALETAGADSGNLASMIPPPRTGGLLATAGYVLLLVLLVGGAFYFFKRGGSLRRPFTRDAGKLQVLETRMLGNRQFLLVVEYEEARMLVGVCPGRIDYLTPLAGHPLMDASEDDDNGAPISLAGAGFGGGR